MRRFETPCLSIDFSLFHLFSNGKETVISWQTNIIFTILLLLFSPISYSQIELKTDSPEDKQTPALKTQGGDSLGVDTPVDEVKLVAEDDDSLERLEVKQSSTQISAELRSNLESQFKQIQKLKKTENAYSERLGEAYFSYALLLQKVGRLDEAREMLVDSLHNSKVNDGVYSIEQRPILRALFENNLINNETEDLVATFEKIVWLENKNPSVIGNYSFDLAVKLGHYYLDLYLIRGSRDDVSLGLLNSSAEYFSYSIRRYGNYELDELLMPYGELSEVHFYRSRIIEKTTKQRISPFAQRGNVFERSNQTQSRRFTEDTFSRAELYSKLHLRKAESENNQEQIVASLLALGDSNLLFNREKQAAIYYKSAWEEAQKLAENDRVRQSFDQPVRLPAFNYVIVKDEPRRQGAIYAHLPIMVDINENGKVVNAANGIVGAINKRAASRARRAAKNSKFRPVIINGEMVASNQHQESIRVLVGNK